MPATIHGSFQGTARTFEESLANEPMLILAALAAVYIVLGMLYESYIHPITILSTLPSAGVGAVLALLLFGQRVQHHRADRRDPPDRHRQEERHHDDRLRARRAARARTARRAMRSTSPALMRFRPIMMTTMAAMLGALPLAFGTGDGAEMRQPLGISIVGGLIVSQVLTLYTTPVIYLYLDRFGVWCEQLWQRLYPDTAIRPAAPRLPAGNMRHASQPSALFALLRARSRAAPSGPNYHRPSAPVPTRFKEAEGWKPAEPREAASGSPGGRCTTIRCSMGSRSRSMSPIRR